MSQSQRTGWKALATSDRVFCTPDAYDNICRELYESLSKYMELTEEDFQVEINRTQVVITFAGEET
ncbi:MAG: cell division topological specificity factor MinE [[Clostridium] scindens]